MASGSSIRDVDTSQEIQSSFPGSGSSGGVGVKARNWDQIKVPGLHPSMLMSDLMNHIGHCISEQMGTDNSSLDDVSECQDILEDIAQHLLNDNQAAETTGEKSLMARVNSLCCLLQKDVPDVNNCSLFGIAVGKDLQTAERDSAVEGKWANNAKPPEEDWKDAPAPGGKQIGGMSRKDSFEDLLAPS